MYSVWYYLQFHVSLERITCGYGGLLIYICIYGGQDNFVGIMTCYMLDSLGFVPQWKRDLPHPLT